MAFGKYGSSKECNSGTRTIHYPNCGPAVIDKELSYIRTSGPLPLIDDKTIGQLFEESAKKWPDREFLVSLHQNQRLTYFQVLERSDKIAAGLKKLGLKKGDHIGIYAPNDNEWIISFIGSLRAGLIVANLNPFYKIIELQYCLQKVQAKAVIAPDSCASQDYVGLLLKAKEACTSVKHIIIYSSEKVGGTISLSEVESLPNKEEIAAIKEEQNQMSASIECNIQFTSGATGRPKATLIANKSFINNSRAFGIRIGMADGQHHKICLNVPLFHVFGMCQGFIAAIRYGGTLVFSSRSFSPKKAIEAVASEKCTIAYGTPTMWINMIDAQLKINADLRSLLIGVSAGSTSSPQLIKRIKGILRIKNIKIAYGLTETTGAFIVSTMDEEAEITETTVGFPLDDLEVKVIDERGQTVPLGMPGELCVRGYNTLLKYWDDEDSTNNVIGNDKYFKTGDQFVLRRDGYAMIVGRLKDMLIRGGENIFPKEIEDFLESHPAIIEAHVFGVNDEIYGEEICACLRLAEGKPLSRQDAEKFIRDNMAKFKVPKYIIFREDFPKTTSGKVQKFVLKQELENQGIIPRYHCKK